MGFFDDLKTVYRGQYSYERHSDEAHWLVSCPTCDSGTMLAVAVGRIPVGLSKEILIGESGWLMCTVCGMGAFAVGPQFDPKRVFPRPLPLPIPEFLEYGVEETWREALRSYSAEAYTGCTLMCRKIIFHMAVEAGLPPKNDKGWAPRFEDCVDHLVNEGYITARQRDQWVDSIRQWGNTATHELEAITQNVARSALEFTLELLRMVYTFSAAAKESSRQLDTAEKTAIPPAADNSRES